MGTWTLRAIRDQGLRVGFLRIFWGALRLWEAWGSGVQGFRGLGV